jgi:hypothetical protein
MKKENVANVVLAITFALMAVSVIFGTAHRIYVENRVLAILEKQEMRRTDLSQAKHVLGLIHDVFTNKYK